MAAAVHESTAPALTQIRSDPALGPGLVVFAVLAVYAVKSGASDPTIWYPGALLLLGLSVTVLYGRLKSGLPRSRSLAAAAGLFAVYAAVAYASITWSHAKGLAWDGANLTLLYLIVYLTCAALPWRRATAATLLAGFGLFATAVGIVELTRAAAASDPTTFFQLGRFAAPFGYQNAACAWYLIAVWPMLLVASRRGAPVVARAVCAAALCALPELALLCQSRASLVAAPVTAAAFLLFVPGRARTIVFAAGAAVPALLTHGPILAVFTAIKSGSGVDHAVAHARNAVLLTAIAGLAAGAIIAVLDRRLAAPRLRRSATRGVYVVCGLAVVALVVGLALALRHPEQRLTRTWQDFKVTKPTTKTSYFANGVGGNRYDIWRVALNEFRDKPLLGVGVDNFEADYLQERRSQEEPLYPHSVELRLLSQTGLVGAALFLGFLGALAVSVRRLNRIPVSRQAVAGTGLAMAVYWLVHGSVDWFWEIPALAGVAFACLGIATSLALEAAPPVRTPRHLRTLLTAVLCATGAVVAVAYSLPWLAAEESVRAATTWRQDPRAAYDRLDTAARLNPLSDEPKVLEGAIASRLNDHARMQSAFAAALRRDPRDWYAHLELAVVASEEGRRSAALRELEAARSLDPLEPVIGDVESDVRAGRPVSAARLDQIFLARIGS
jgi:O-antigen ligase/polysaccharide polymerase Wzy-like membrane protein